MDSIQLAATYILGSIILYSLTGFSWLITLGGMLALSAIARHLYTESD